MRVANLVVVVFAAGCSVAATPSSKPAEASPEPTASPTVTASALDLTEIVIAPESPPSGMNLSDEGGGAAALQTLPLTPETAAALQAQQGFVDGRWSRFAGSEADFAMSRNFALTWVAQYGTPGDATDAFLILLNELESEEGYGWGTGEDAGLGDAGTCLDGENPEMGGLKETICVWRRGTLVLVAGGGTRNEVPIEAIADGMDSRAEALDP